MVNCFKGIITLFKKKLYSKNINKEKNNIFSREDSINSSDSNECLINNIENDESLIDTKNKIITNVEILNSMYIINIKVSDKINTITLPVHIFPNHNYDDNGKRIEITELELINGTDYHTLGRIKECPKYYLYPALKQITLDKNINKYILNSLPIQDLLVLQNLNHTNIQIHDYLRNRFDIKNYIKPFIKDIDQLFNIMVDGKMYLSGSTVLQAIIGKSFFNPNDPQDLDIYLPDRFNPKYSTMINNDEYLFKLLKFLISSEGYVNDITPFTGRNSLNTYFKLTKGNKKIDIIIDNKDIQEIVREFYSSHVMNYYNPSTNTICSVRPYATFNHLSFITDKFLREYKTDYMVEFENEFSPKFIDVDETNQQLENIKTINKAIKSSNNYNEAVTKLQSLKTVTKTVEIHEYKSKDEFKQYSTYFKFKKIEAIIKYKNRGFIFKDWSQAHNSSRYYVPQSQLQFEKVLWTNY
jgi:hypothetical protein